MHPGRSVRFATLGLFAAVATAPATGCRDAQGPGPDPSPPVSLPALTVSDAVGDVAYASLPPGGLPNGHRIVIETRRTGALATADLVDGGLDPIRLAAAAGDTLDLRVSLGDGEDVREYVSVVSGRRPPLLVRTYPAPGAGGVPLNAGLLLVFSEPIEPTRLTGSAIRVSQAGVPLDGTAAIGDDDHLTVRFTPAALLAPETRHSVTVTPEIADLSGETIETPVTVEFMTRSALAPVLAIYERESPHQVSGTRSRYLIRDDGAFEFQHESALFGFRSITGRFERSDATLTFAYDGWSSWAATATVEGDSLVVEYGGDTPARDFEPGVYRRSTATDPSPAPGSKIAFVSDRSVIGGLYVANPDGSEMTLLTPGAEPAWSPDGRRLAFVRIEGETPAIWIMNADGSGQARVGEGRTPSWSPDGSRIVFSSRRAIEVMNRDGSGRRELIRLGFPGMAVGSNELARPSWSPDGRRIAFDSRGGTVPMLWQQVYVMNADGSQPRPLGPDPFAKSDPSWSPDGKRIAVQTYDYVIGDSLGYDNVLATYDVETGERQIHYRPHMQFFGMWGPDYSPDGRTLVFTQLLSGRYRLLFLDLETGDVRAFLPEAVSPEHPDYFDTDPAWSRTGAR